jgi:hypothetical protein
MVINDTNSLFAKEIRLCGLTRKQARLSKIGRKLRRY